MLKSGTSRVAWTPTAAAAGQAMMLIERNQALLERIGLATLEGVKSFRGEVIESVAGKRDVQRIHATDEAGRPLVMYLKRHWRSDRKEALLSLLKHGRVWSVARVEWENARILQRAGFHTAELVACGDEMTLLGERFSFLLTEAARGPVTLGQFNQDCRDRTLRRKVFDALALELRRLHDVGLSMPDLFSRHVFFDPAADPLEFSFIDVARLDRRRHLPNIHRARGLAALNVTSPLRFVSTRERVRFLRVYAGNGPLRSFVTQIEARTTRLLERKKYRSFLETAAKSGGKTTQNS